jgi:hypothetical protein
MVMPLVQRKANREQQKRPQEEAGTFGVQAHEKKSLRSKSGIARVERGKVGRVAGFFFLIVILIVILI